MEDEDAEKFFESLVERMTDRMMARMNVLFAEANAAKAQSKDEDDDLWVKSERAKRILKIKSKKKLQYLRDHNLITSSRNGRTITYYKPSLLEFQEKNIQV